MATNPALRDRETRGATTSERHYILEKEEIDKFKARGRHEFPPNQPDVLFTAIDPSGGGTGSDFVILTLALIGASNQITVSAKHYISGVRSSLRAFSRFSSLREAMASCSNWASSSGRNSQWAR